MCIISIINNKGGVGKTTSTSVIAELLAYLGKTLLVVDLDAQSNLSMFFHEHDEDDQEVLSGFKQPQKQNIYELFKYKYRNKEEVQKLIRRTNIEGIDIIPSSKRHRKTPSELANDIGNINVILKRALKSINENYDFILIDNAPADNILTVNSMFASDYILIPVRVESYSYKGLRETLSSILYIKEEHDLDKIEFLGAFITQVNSQTNVYKEIKAQYELELGNKFFKNPVRIDTKINEIEVNLKPLLSYSLESNALIDYAKLVLEMDILDKNSKEILYKSISGNI